MQPAITIIIKTFERPKSLKKLLLSIKTLGLKYPILIADDSKVSYETDIKKAFPGLSITWLSLPFDSGLSEGRNVLLNNVTTPYFLLCDDDFVFDGRADIEKALKCIQENNLDILGGDFYNYVTIHSLRRLAKLIVSDPAKIKMFLFGQFKTSRYLGVFNLKANNSCELLLTNKKPAASPYPCDLVNNFFIAGTEAVKKMGGWDPSLKLGEHEDFFFRAKLNKLSVAYLPDFGTRHFPIIRSNYKKYRLRAEQYKNMFVKKHKFRHYVEKMTDTDTVLFEVG